MPIVAEMMRFLLWIPNYVRAFGMCSGLRLFGAALLARCSHGDTPRPFRVPGCPSRVWVRPGNSDVSIFQQVFVNQDYRMTDMAQFRRLEAIYHATLAQGERPLIIDCGANIGLATLWFRRCFPESTIYAIEPDSKNFDVLARNIARLENVTALQGGVWDRECTVALDNGEAGPSAFRFIETESGRDGGIRAYTIDQILELAGQSSPFIVKVDIEGGEAALFRSGTSWLGKVSLVVIELHDWLYPWAGTSRNFLSQSLRYSFDYLFRGENLFCFRS